MLVLRQQNANALPTNEVFQRDLAWAHFTLSEAYRLGNQLGEAELHSREAKAISSTLLKSDSLDAAKRRQVGWSTRHLGRIFALRGNSSEALTELRAARTLLRSVTDGAPENLHWRFEYAATLSDLGDVYSLLGNFSAADEALQGSRIVFNEVPVRQLVRSENRRERAVLVERLNALNKALEATSQGTAP